MKQIRLNFGVTVASAITSLICASFGDIMNDRKANVRYFQVLPHCLSKITTTTISDAQVTFHSVTNPGDICSGFGYLCIVSIDTVDLTSGKQHLKSGQKPIQTVISTHTCH